MLGGLSPIESVLDTEREVEEGLTAATVQSAAVNGVVDDRINEEEDDGARMEAVEKRGDWCGKNPRAEVDSGELISFECDDSSIPFLSSTPFPLSLGTGWHSGGSLDHFNRHCV